MSSLMQLKQEEYQIMSELAENLGEISDEKLAYWQNLTEMIKQKTAGYVSVIRKGGLIDFEIEQIDKKVDELKELKTELEEKREWMEEKLYNVINETEEKYFQYDTKAFVKPYIRQNRKVNMEKVEPNMGHYVIPKLTPEEFREVMHLVAQKGNIELLSKLDQQNKHGAILSELPDDHAAIETKIRKSIKIVATKPKKEIYEREAI